MAKLAAEIAKDIRKEAKEMEKEAKRLRDIADDLDPKPKTKKRKA